MPEVIFKPKYPVPFAFGVLAFASLELFSLWQILFLKHASLENYFATLFFGLLLVILPLTYIKQIVFRENNFTVEKYVFPAKTIDYADVINVGKKEIKLRKGNLSFRMIVNTDEASNILAALITQGIINQPRLEESSLDDEARKTNNPFLYRLHRIMFGIQFVGLWLVILSFMYLLIFGGALDIMGDFADYRPTARILPLAFLLTLSSYKLYPKLKKQKLVMLGLLLPAMVLNAALAVSAVGLLYQFVPWLLILV